MQVSAPSLGACQPCPDVPPGVPGVAVVLPPVQCIKSLQVLGHMREPCSSAEWEGPRG